MTGPRCSPRGERRERPSPPLRRSACATSAGGPPPRHAATSGAGSADPQPRAHSSAAPGRANALRVASPPSRPARLGSCPWAPSLDVRYARARTSCRAPPLLPRPAHRPGHSMRDDLLVRTRRGATVQRADTPPRVSAAHRRGPPHASMRGHGRGGAEPSDLLPFPPFPP